jgi:hypothetical protein
MAKLVECLVAGIAGATSGTATFVLRGTASSAASVLYNDFEMTTQPGTNIITLDSNGCAEIYVNAYCDMTLKNQAGTTLRTVTVGDSATTVEVISDSFTGTDYSGSPSAVSEPITLAAVLDKWNNSAGANDWKVLVGGVSTNLSSAVAGFTGMFVNVKDPAYAAVGDGVADDTTPIANAIADADGGIVFFPPGTYKVSGISLTEASFHLMGSGAGISKITSATVSADILAITDNTLSGIKIVEGLGFESSAAVRYHALMEEGQNVFFNNCVFDATNADSAISNNTATLDTYYHFTDCKFLVGATTNSAILTGNSTEPVSYLINNCVFTVASGFTGDVLQGPGMHVTNCVFDASAVTSGVYYHVDAQSSNVSGVYIGTFIGNKFYDGGSSGFAFDFRGLVANSNFREDNNVFIGFTDPTVILDQGHIYNFPTTNSASQIGNNIILGSRRGKTLTLSVSADVTINLSCAIMAENIIINTTEASNGSIAIGGTLGSSDFGYEGMRTFITAFNNDGSAREMILGVGGTHTTQVTVPAGGVSFFETVKVIESVGNAIRTIVISSGQYST